MPTRRRLKCAVVTAVAPAVVTATVLVAPATAARAASTQAVPPAPAAIVLSVASGPVGTPVTVTGTGFAAKKAAVVAVGDGDAGRAVDGPAGLGCAVGHRQPFEVKVGMTCSKLTDWPRPVAMMSVSPATTARTTTA